MSQIPEKDRKPFLGVPVVEWITKTEAATLLGVTTRWLQDLEARGLPSCGSRKAKRFPIPHLIAWTVASDIRRARHENVAQLPFAVAWAEYQLSVAEDDARHDGAHTEQARPSAREN